MALFERFTNPVWHFACTLDKDRQRIAALLIVGYDYLRSALKEQIIDPLESSELVPPYSITSDIRERLVDEAIIGLLKSCSVPESDPSGKIPDRVVSTLPEVWGLFALADRNFRLKCIEPETLEGAHYSKDPDEARTQVLAKWTEILDMLQPNFVAEANKRWFYRAWNELSVVFVNGALAGFTGTPDELVLKRARRLSADIPYHRIAKTRAMLELIAKAPLASAQVKLAPEQPKSEIPRRQRDLSVFPDLRDPKVQLLRGYAYLVGEGVPQDYKQAAAWYRKAAEQGLAGAQVCLAGLYERGEGVQKDHAQAMRWYRKAAEQGDVDGQFNLGKTCYLGLGARESHSEAALWFGLAAEQGHVDAQFMLGGMCCNGLGCPKDNHKAIAWFRKAAEQGLADAQFNLGMGYFKGDGVPEDDSQAAVWFRKAAEQGHARAQYLLGCQYEKGQGVLQDRSQGVAWYRKAADQGEADAQCLLGLSYRDGSGVQQSYTQSAIWLEKAADQGNADAQTALGYMYRDGQGVQRDEAQAAFLFRKAAEQGDVFAQVNIAFMHYEGQGVPRDYARAADWYRKAAEQGDIASQENLGILYRDGEGVPQNYVESYYWLSVAIAGASEPDILRFS
jgi:TPR repeat protein